MENKEKDKSSKFFSGFVVGAMLSAGIVLFVTTKKGKKILKLLKEEAGEAMEEVEDTLVEKEKVSNLSDNDDEAVSTPHFVASDTIEELVKTASGVAASGKRFFKRSKNSN